MLQRALTLLTLLLITGLPAQADDGATESIKSNWIDRSHKAMQLRTQKTAIWFDSFFGDHCDEEEPAIMRARISLGSEASEHGFNNNYARVRAKVKLPNLKKRFYLVLSNEDKDDSNLLPLEASRPEEAVDSTDNYSAALSWIKRTPLKKKSRPDLGCALDLISTFSVVTAAITT